MTMPCIDPRIPLIAPNPPPFPLRSNNSCHAHMAKHTAHGYTSVPVGLNPKHKTAHAAGLTAHVLKQEADAISTQFTDRWVTFFPEEYGFF